MPYQATPELAAFLADLPKTETHLHIEGALPFHFVHEADPVTYPKVPASWADDFKFRSFAHFEEELLAMVAQWYHSPERYYTAASEVFDKLYHQHGVRYVECSFASGIIEFIGGDGSANATAIKSAAPDGMDVRVFMGIHHPGYNQRTVAWIDDSVNWPDLDGIDLHGPEDQPMGDWAPMLWSRFQAAGKRTKAHAGEFCGPDFVRYALDSLGVKRIQHGVRSVESPELVERLSREGVVLDVCPISNVKLDVVPSMREHPIRRLFDAGVCCTISTDDPISFGNNLTEEYVALYQDLGFTLEELGQIARNGFLSADLDVNQKNRYGARIEQAVAEHSTGDK